MFSYLTGKVFSTEQNQIVVLNNGVGWLVNVGEASFEIGQDVKLYLHTHIRQDDISLWGFGEARELKLFKMLIGVSGVGPKTAILLLTTKGVDMIVLAILNNLASDLKVSGIGVKTVQKIIIELKDKISEEIPVVSIVGKEEGSKDSNIINKRRDIMEALSTLGYSSKEVESLVDKFLQESSDVSYVVKMVLSNVSKK